MGSRKMDEPICREGMEMQRAEKGLCGHSEGGKEWDK